MRKLAIFTLGSCLALGTAGLCAAQDQNQTTTSSSSSTTTTTPNANTNNTANPNAPTGTAHRRMPNTDASWVNMLLGGGLLSGLGMTLRSKLRG